MTMPAETPSLVERLRAWLSQPPTAAFWIWGLVICVVAQLTLGLFVVPRLLAFFGLPAHD